ncbi:MAG: DUF2490 domain-containing protein [Cyclobacteriaceae bacterium]|nr:DUF2490 domain-containing protein [Cyclobacteriaceae bacterium]
MLHVHAVVVKAFRFNIFIDFSGKHSVQNAFCFIDPRSQKFKISLFIIFLIGSGNLFAQSNITYQSLYWIRYYNQSQLSSKITFHLELDERRLINPDRQAQFFIHTHLHKKISPALDVAVGFSHVRSNSPKNTDLVMPEWRFFQEISYTLSKATKTHWQIRYRLDERFIHNRDKDQLVDGFMFVLRHRFRAQFTWPIKIVEGGQTVSLKISDEIMFNSTSNANPFDQNRIYIGLEWPLSNKWSAELGYLKLHAATLTAESVLDIIRLSIYHRLSFVSKE